MSVKAYGQRSKNFPISRSGDILDTQVTLIGDPVRDDEAATKQYVDKVVVTGSEAGFVPIFLFNRWYFPFYLSTPGYPDFALPLAKSAYAALRYVGRPVTWSRMRIIGGHYIFEAPRHEIEVGLYEVESDTLLPTHLVWRSGLRIAVENAVNTKTGAVIKQAFDIVVPDVSTYTPWVAYGVYFRRDGHWLYSEAAGRGSFGFFGGTGMPWPRVSFRDGPTLNGLPSAFNWHTASGPFYVFGLAAMPSRPV